MNHPATGHTRGHNNRRPVRLDSLICIHYARPLGRRMKKARNKSKLLDKWTHSGSPFRHENRDKLDLDQIQMRAARIRYNLAVGNGQVRVITK